VSVKRRNPRILPVPIDVLLPLGVKRRSGELTRAEIDVLRTRLASRQEGVVGRVQLLALGFTRHEIEHDVERGRLIAIHQGVYAVGHEALSDRGRMIAALLAAGPGAALSHETAAYHWTLIPSMPPFIDVTLTDRQPRTRHGVRVHRAQHLETTTHKALHVTTPLQTIAQLRDETRDRARAEAIIKRLVPRQADDHVEPTRSELEDALLPALQAAQLPKPLVNTIVLGHEVDFFWPDHRLVVETDGWSTHGNRRAFESDRARDARLVAAGYRVLRFTWRQVIRQTLLVTVQIAQALAR
jgi:very-short-patch-repair endonuclease